jgi:hypothetical protein
MGTWRFQSRFGFQASKIGFEPIRNTPSEIGIEPTNTCGFSAGKKDSGATKMRGNNHQKPQS